MKAFLKNLGIQMRLLRTAKGYTQENMEEFLPVSASAYARIERGETDVKVSRIEEIAQVFGLTATQLINVASQLDGEDKPPAAAGNARLEDIYSELKTVKEMLIAMSGQNGQ